MKILKICPLIFIIFMIGCGSKVPIADLSKAVENDDILGNWTSVDQDSNEYIGFSICKFNDLEYSAWVYEEKYDSLNTERDIYFYRVYLIEIGNTVFINAQDINSGNPHDRLFHFLKYEKNSDSTVTLTTLKDIEETKIDGFESSDKLYSFIHKNLKNEKLYGDSVQLIRVKKIRSF